MTNFRGGFWPTLMTIPIIATLLALSAWQLYRYGVKVELIETINSQLSAPAVALPATDIVPADWFYKRVTLRGHFDHGSELHLFSHTKKGRKGFQIITPLVRSDNEGIVLVNRGWVPEEMKLAKNRMAGQAEGVQELTGIVRTPWGKAWDFMPASNAESNVWLYGELDAMAAHLGVKVAPVFVELDKMDVSGGFPMGGQTRVSLPNNHISYFLTWLGLAAAMAVIYVLYGRRRAKELNS